MTRKVIFDVQNIYSVVFLRKLYSYGITEEGWLLVLRSLKWEKTKKSEKKFKEQKWTINIGHSVLGSPDCPFVSSHQEQRFLAVQLTEARTLNHILLINLSFLDKWETERHRQTERERQKKIDKEWERIDERKWRIQLLNSADDLVLDKAVILCHVSCHLDLEYCWSSFNCPFHSFVTY